MRVFIGGVMQGGRAGLEIAPQHYRERIAEIIRVHVDGAEIWDPYRLHPNSVEYAPEQARRTFVEMSELAATADCLVAYLPEASMGTAIEMWQAHRAGIPVYTISPFVDNWVVLTLSTRVLPDLDAFARFVAAGGLDG